VRTFLPHLMKRGSGHIVNTASLAGLVPIPLVAPYCAAKYALVGMTECLADELRRTTPGIGVTLLCPGLVETRLSLTSKRHAPESLAGVESCVADPAELALLIERSGEMLSAETVAEMALEGIEKRRLHVFTHGDLHLRLREQLVDRQPKGDVDVHMDPR